MVLTSIRFTLIRYQIRALCTYELLGNSLDSCNVATSSACDARSVSPNTTLHLFRLHKILKLEIIFLSCWGCCESRFKWNTFFDVPRCLQMNICSAVFALYRQLSTAGWSSSRYSLLDAHYLLVHSFCSRFRAQTSHSTMALRSSRSWNTISFLSSVLLFHRSELKSPIVMLMSLLGVVFWAAFIWL